MQFCSKLAAARHPHGRHFYSTVVGAYIHTYTYAHTRPAAWWPGGLVARYFTLHRIARTPCECHSPIIRLAVVGMCPYHCAGPLVARYA